MNQDTNTDLRSLRSLLVTRSVGSEGWIAAMYGQMVAVMDNHIAVKRSGRGRHHLSMPKRKQHVREFHREVSRTINAAFGVKLPYR